MLRFAMVALVCLFGTVSGVASPRESLAILEGSWTLEGMEDTYLETCEWFDGRSHMICSGESRGPAGADRGVSIFSYSEEKQRFLYYHYGSGGRANPQDVFIDGSTLYATSESQSRGDLIRTQVTMTRRADGSFDFVRQQSRNGKEWKTVTTLHYVRAGVRGGAR